MAGLEQTDTSVHESGATADDVIKAWAESRGGTPADVEGAGDGGGAGVLRVEFPDEGDRRPAA